MDNKVMQTTDELQNQLKEQLEFLLASSKSYDKGFTSEAKRLAATIRILVHDTSKSTSLLKQLNLKGKKFFSTTIKGSKINANQLKIGSYCGLVGISIGKDVEGYVPYLDETPDEITGYIDFNSYWNETIFTNNERNDYSRKDVVLSVANQDGGSHVDPKLSEKYAKLSRQNSLGWQSEDSKGKLCTIKGAELAAVRQIAHELLRTLLQNYPQQKNLNKHGAAIIGGTGIMLTLNHVSKSNKVGRNDPCPCGSGKKYKKCCMRKNG